MIKQYPVIDVIRTGRNIKKIMMERGFSVKDVQQYLNLGSPQGIYMWINGNHLPTIDNLYALSELFQVSMDSIIVGSKDDVKCSFTDPFMRRMYIYSVKIQSLLRNSA